MDIKENIERLIVGIYKLGNLPRLRFVEGDCHGAFWPLARNIYLD